MDKQPSIPIPIPGKSQKTDVNYTKTQHSSCLTKLYGISPDVKVSQEVYMSWCREQQNIIDDFIHKRRAVETKVN